MEELGPQELGDLLQELEEEYGAQESLPQEVEELLHVLQSGPPLDRCDAAEQLGEVGTSSPQIVRALIAAYESDAYSMVNRAAAKALRVPVHQGYLKEHPDLMEATERAIKQRAGADKQRSRLDTKRVLLLLGAFLPVLAYIVGIFVGGYIATPSNLSLSGYLDIAFRRYQVPKLICGLPGLALSLFLLWLASVTTQKEKRSGVIVVILICLCAIVTLAVGFGMGLFLMLG